MSSASPLFLLPLFLSSFLAISYQSSPPHAKQQPQDSTTMLPSELETLFTIMGTMSDNKPWRISHPNPCNSGSSWPGIECKFGKDNHFHVTRLDFGTPPNPTCKPTSTFPSEVFTLPYLQSVFFYNCFTHSPTSLSMPASPVSPVEQLSLRANPALTGPIPAQLSSLKSLQVLTLSQNRLSGQIPPGVFGLIKLVHLDLSYNTLSGAIPSQVGNVKNLLGLDLSYNSLSGVIPNSIGQLGLLQKLDLSSNLLVGGIPNSIEKLNSLNFIALSNNRLKGSFPEGLTKLVNLQYFIMDDNPMFMPLPSDFGTLVKLQELRLANSGYSGSIPSSISQLLNLTTLSLENNRLTGKIPAEFSSLSHIYHLNLSRNFLEGVVPFSASFLRRLGRNLDLSGNPGLCLDPKEAHGLGTEINACGDHKSYSFAQPTKRSQAPCMLSSLSAYVARETSRRFMLVCA
ncbi:hypothetical protein Cgig2_022611 [Carnegiea gigantea]|uniref:non-specific serine/threonine protein kinase n=1 Tax=Carnegiea gigantea TaxID=171969 RepID=A0A9Q1GMH3_9CARY|nr:hypothetical protein Cgig2_022611 [Carnegiea gigantea]